MKSVVGDRIMNVFSQYTPHLGKSDEEEESFCNSVFQAVSGISVDDMVLFADDMNCHVGKSRK